MVRVEEYKNRSAVPQTTSFLVRLATMELVVRTINSIVANLTRKDVVGGTAD